MDIVEKAGFCALCRSRCGTINVFGDGRFLEVRPDRSHPTGSALCPKGRAAPEIAQSARRLSYPMRRTKPKGAADPGWVRISWEEALAEVSERMLHYRARNGAESVAFAMTSQSSSSISDSREWLQRFMRLFGSPNCCFSVEICNWHKDYGHAFTFGVGLQTPDYGNADLMVLWGADPANSWLAQANAIGEARARGARLLVVDPHRSGSALNADVWCRIAPGTDGALALGIIALLIERQAYNDEFVRAWTNAPFLVRDDTGLFLRGRDLGWTEPDAYAVFSTRAGEPVAANPAAERVALEGRFEIATASGTVSCRPAFDVLREACAPYTPEAVERICTVPASQVRELAELYASAASVCYYLWTGLGQHTNATQTDRAVAILHALTGSFDAPGGNVVFAKHPARRVNDIDFLDKAQRAKTFGIDERPLGPARYGWITSRELWNAVLDNDPYPVRALIGFGSNILVSHPDPERTRAALEKIDFYVHCDLFMNPTAEFADIVLPVNSAWERESLRVGFEITQSAEELVQLRQKMLPSVGESRSDMEIVFDLACRVGLAKEFFDGDIEAALSHVIEPIGITMKELRDNPSGIRKPLKQQYTKYRQSGFATETNRVEIYSELFQRHGYSPVPQFTAPAEDVTPAYPYRLTTGNRGYFCHSQHRGISSLRRRSPEPEVRMHPSLGERAGLRAGDWAAIESRIGGAHMRVRLDESIHPEVVVADYGFWQACPDLGLPGSRPGDPNGSNYNNLISNTDFDPVSGSLALRSFTCNLKPALPGAWEGFRELVVSARRVEADGIVSLSLAAPNDEPLPPTRPGQYLALRLGETSRSYSLTGATDDEPRHYTITVKDMGPVSHIVTNELAVGDRVQSLAPAGLFLLPPRNEFPVVLIAAGIGITPFMSLLRSITGAAHEPQVTLYYCCRDASSRAFGDELVALASRLPNLSIVHHLTAPARGHRHDVKGRIEAASIDQQLIDRRARFYMCGPAAMMKSMTQGLMARGVMKFEIFQELFQSSGAAVPMDAGSFKVRFARSNKTIDWTPKAGTILSSAEAAGLNLPNGCRVGQCESCTANVISGKVNHLVDVAVDDENACLTCQAIPGSDLVLDL